MAGRKRKNKFSGFGLMIAAAAIVIAALVAGNSKSLNSFISGSSASPAASNGNISKTALPLKNLSVHFIDVGQGDSIFVYCDGSTMLIDAGVPDMGQKVVNYLKSYKISRLDYLVGTHPHDDHIGGIADVFGSVKAGTIFMTRATNNTSTYENLLNKIASKSMKITVPTPGRSFKLGGATCTFIAPNSASYQDLNNMSVVIRLVYGKRSFLFTGDASGPSEEDMIKKGYDLKSDVLKVGHHGSSSATGAEFLSAVSPKYAVISVGAGNSYGHPAQSTLNRLDKAGATVLRTDLNGTVVFQSDGSSLTYSTEK